LNTWIISDLRRCLLAAAALAALALGFCYALAPAPLAAAPAPQAGTLALELTKTLQGSDVVRVGQVLTFTIRLRNTGTISITHIPLLDEYDAGVLRLERTNPLSTTSIVTPAAGLGAITWTDLPTATVGGPLPPGQSFEVVTVFRAIAPREVTVNRARAGTLLGWGGASGAGGSAEDQGRAEGGRLLVDKGLAPGQTPRSGAPITFTIAITNDGAADVVRVPLRDTYSTTHLLFWRAEPPPSAMDPVAGRLEWGDLLPGLGLSRLRPGQVVTVTTVFTALRSIDGAVVNRAEAFGVRDEFGNEVAAPRRADVPIRILPGPAEATPRPATTTPTPRPERPRERPTDTPEPTPTATPVAPVTDTTGLTDTAAISETGPVSGTAGAAPVSDTAGLAPTPAALPRTGAPRDTDGWALAALALLAAGVLAALLARRTGGSAG
jgi:uncharacterized repeat protein (TIGR01451 family)